MARGEWARAEVLTGQAGTVLRRAVLEDAYAAREQRWPEGTVVPMPDFWGGYRLAHEIVEFWQGRPSRLHDRLRYERDGARWVVQRLAP